MNTEREYTESISAVRGIVQGIFWSGLCFWGPMAACYALSQHIW